MNEILTLAGKDLRLLVRNRASLFWILAFPLMLALFFGLTFGSSGELIVNATSTSPDIGGLASSGSSLAIKVLLLASMPLALSNWVAINREPLVAVPM